MIGLIGLMVIVAGIVQLGEGGRQLLDIHVDAAEDAWNEAAPNPRWHTLNRHYPFVQTWRASTDNLSFSADDYAVTSQPNTFFQTYHRALVSSAPFNYNAFKPFKGGPPSSSNSAQNAADDVNANNPTTTDWAMWDDWREGDIQYSLHLGWVDYSFARREHNRIWRNNTVNVNFGDGLRRLVYRGHQGWIDLDYIAVYLPPMTSLH